MEPRAKTEPLLAAMLNFAFGLLVFLFSSDAMRERMVHVIECYLLYFALPATGCALIFLTMITNQNKSTRGKE